MVRSDARGVVLDGKEEFRNDQQAITSPVTALAFGDLTYTLVFTTLAEKQLSKLRKAKGERNETLRYLNPTPSSTDYVLQKYSIKGVFARGSTCIVSFGYNRLTGGPVAIRKMKRQARNSAKIDREIKLVRAPSPHVRKHTISFSCHLLTFHSLEYVS